MASAFDGINQGFGNLQQALMYRQQMDRQNRMDQQAQEQNALAQMVQRAQLEQLEQQQQLEQQTRGIYKQSAMSPQGPYREGLQNPYATPEGLVKGLRSVGNYKQASTEQTNALAQQKTLYDIMKSMQPEYQIIDGQYVPKQPGSSAMPVPGFVPAEKSPLVQIGPDGSLPAGPGNKKFLEETGSLQAKRLDDITRQAQSALERSYGIQTQRATIQQGLKTGAFAPLVNAVAGYLDGFNIDPTTLKLPDPTKGQIFDVSTFDNLLKALQAQKGPQTEGDAARALKTFASMKNTEEANMFILDYMDEMANRAQMMADLVDDRAYGKYANTNRPVSLAEKEFRAWARKTPAVAASKRTGIPVTYSSYKEAALENGVPPEKIDEEWRKFAGVK